MNKKEFMTIVTILETVYDRFKISNDDTKLNIWFDMLKDLDVQTCKMATQKLICEFQYPPTIADIRKRCVDVKTEQLTSDEAWGQVQKAIRKYGIYREAEALQGMNPLVSQIIQNIGWNHICMTELENMATLRAQFRGYFEGKTQKQKSEALLPNDLKQMINGLADKLMIEG